MLHGQDERQSRTDHQQQPEVLTKVFSRWQGPAKVIERKSPHSYIVELNGVNRHLHADKLRQYHVSVQEVLAKPLQNDAENHEDKVDHCAIIYDDDKDFGEVEVVDTSPPLSELLPSQKIDPDKLKHLSDQPEKELLAVSDKYPECFSDKPGLCTLVTHEINVTSDFKPNDCPLSFVRAIQKVFQPLKRCTDSYVDDTCSVLQHQLLKY